MMARVVDELVNIVDALPVGEVVAVVVHARVPVVGTGLHVDVPAVLTNRGIIQPLLDFCCDNKEKRSPDWLKKLCSACVLFIEFAAVNRSMSDLDLLKSFGNRLLTGTFDGSLGVDPSGLCWTPVSRPTARRTLSQLLTFFSEFEELRKKLQAPATPFDRVMDRAAYATAREHAFLGHTWPIDPVQTEGEPGGAVRTSTYMPKPLSGRRGEPAGFPEDRFMDLLLKGWCVGGRYSFRDMLITLLLDAGGVRPSEPFHMYVTDVHEDGEDHDMPVVLMHHPLEGAAPEDWVNGFGELETGNRRTYLKMRWGIEPRTLQLGSKHAGWKGAALSKDYGTLAFRVYWFVPQMGRLFMKIWKRYLVDLVSIPRNHPFAFANMLRGHVGEEYKMSAFRQAHAAAVRRIGLTPSMSDGTHRHGHRHAYGRRLAAAGVPGDDIQHYMHHRSYGSHEVYTRAKEAEVLKSLDAAAARLSSTAEARKWDSFVDEVGYRLQRM